MTENLPLPPASTQNWEAPVTESTETTTSLFSPAGVDWLPVSTDLIKVKRLTRISVVFLSAVAGIITAVVSELYWLIAVVLIAAAIIAVWLFWLSSRQVRAIGYYLDTDELLIKSGIMFQSMNVVPYGRMQTIDINKGPLLRKFKLASLTLNTASMLTSAQLTGLPDEVANQLREELTKKAESRRAGL